MSDTGSVARGGHVTLQSEVEAIAGSALLVIGARWKCCCGDAAEFVLGQVVDGDRIESVRRARMLAGASALMHLLGQR